MTWLLTKGYENAGKTMVWEAYVSRHGAMKTGAPYPGFNKFSDDGG